MLDTKGNRITYFGHSTFTLTTESGKVALIDPFVKNNPLCPPSLHNIPKLDAILLSHAHDDHMADLLDIAAQHHPPIAAIFETAVWLASKGFEKDIRPMSKGGSQKISEFEVTMTHAFHSNSINTDGVRIYAGEPAGLIIRMPGDFTVYHAGDTAVFGDMGLIGELYKPDVAMLPIGDLFTMGPREAAHAVKLLGVKHAIPMHHSTFPMLTGTPDAFREQCKGITGLEIHALRPGESI